VSYIYETLCKAKLITLVLTCYRFFFSDDTNVQTVYDLLKMPLHYYFGYQIFDLNFEPNKFEKVASSLQVNLLYSILVKACPNISCYNKRNCSNIKDSEYIIILNQNQAKSVQIH